MSTSSLDTTTTTLDLLLRLDAVRGKDLHQIAKTALEILLELCNATSGFLKIALDSVKHPIVATLDPSCSEPQFPDSATEFEDVTPAMTDSVEGELKDNNFYLWCRLVDPHIVNPQGVIDSFLKRLAGAVAYRCLQEELQKNTNEMHRLRLNLEYSFNSVPDAIATMDEDMRFMSVNKAFLSIYGGVLSDYKGKFLKDCFNDTSIPYESVVRQTLELGRITSHFRVNMTNPEGKECRLELSAAPLRTGDCSFGGVVLVIKDMTRLAVLEQQLEERKMLNNMVGKSKSMQHVASLVQSLTDIETTVLITGESGTGKELIADALHYGGIRADKKIVKVNCAALSESLLESELFGHVRGAFTGAVQSSEGRVAAAEGGTLFLDEIGDIPLSIQLKLLRFLEYKQYERVGSSHQRNADVRVVTATNADLEHKVKEGTFRKDLYYRLNVFQIEIPPLRERKEDIPLLAKSFVTVFNNELGRSIKSISPEFMNILIQYDWPGNVRELRHCIEYAAILCLDEILTSIHLPQNFREKLMCFCPPVIEKQPKPVEWSNDEGGFLKQSSFDAEKVRAALEQANGKKAHAARILGVSRPTLYRWIKRAGIDML